MLINKEQFYKNVKHLLTDTFYKDEMTHSLTIHGEYIMNVDTFTFEDEDLARLAAKQLMKDWKDADDVKLKSIIEDCIGLKVKVIKTKRLFRLIAVMV